VSQIYRVDVMHTVHLQTAINSWHLRCPDTGITDTLLQDWVTGMITPQRTNTPNTVTFNELQYRRVDIGGTSGAVFIPTAWPIAGATTGPEMPSFCAMLIKGVASGQPRPNKIRKFLPGILEADTSGSVYASSGTTKIDAITDAWQTWVDAGNDLLPVAASYVPGTGLPPEDNVDGRWNLITDFSFSPNIAVMRSRKVGHGI